MGTIQVIVAILVAGVLLYKLSDKLKEYKRKSESYSSKPPGNSYNQKSEYADLMKPQKSNATLKEHKKIEGEITSDTVTLITKSGSGRDEFFGWIDIIDGHHTEPSVSRDYEKIQSWEYLGSGDRFDASQRSRDFKQLRTQLKQKVDRLIATMSSDSWTSEISSEDEKQQIYLLSRNND